MLKGTGRTGHLVRALALFSTAVVILAAPPAFAQEGPTVPRSAAENPDLWFVELQSPPTTDGTSINTTRREKAAFRAEARRRGLDYSERRAFDTLWNGLSIRLAASQLDTLTQVPGVKAVHPVDTVALPPRDDVADPQLATATAMTGADVAQNELGLSGTGVNVGVIDTGLDYDHPDLGGCFGPGCRVEGGYDFTGDDFTGSQTPPVPDEDPDDCNGHGTHVAGNIGANGQVTGVAPGVAFTAYKVFGCEGQTTADIMLQAMERALADQVDVVNMSIGAPFAWPQYPTAQGADRLVRRGIPVVASIGNRGEDGLYSSSAPGVADQAIGVASYDNTHTNLPVFTITPDGTKIGYISAEGAPPPPTSGSFPMARTGTPTSTNDACDPLPADSLTGQVALIRRGACGFHTKARNAELAGAAGAVIYNNVPGRFGASLSGEPAVTIPVVTVSDTEGVLIDGRLADGPVTMTWTADTEAFPNATGNQISDFSSYGPGPDLTLKPDLGAPGGFIRSTYPLEQGGYATLSGTSMASPHVAGAVALLLERRPNTPANAVRTIFQNTADPKPPSDDPGALDNVHRQGGGMLDIPGAVLAEATVEPSKLSLGESQAGPATRTLTIRNRSNAPKTYQLTHAAARATGPDTLNVTHHDAPATVAFTSAGNPVTDVTVPGGGTATINATITAPASLADRGLYGGYLTLTNTQAPAEVYRVPYTGFKGDYQSIPVLTPTVNGFPWLARWQGDDFYKVPPASSTFSLTGETNVPYVLAHVDHPVRRLRIEVFDAATGRPWHTAVDIQYLERNATPRNFYYFSFNGETRRGNRTYTVPDGQYVLRLTVVKALGTEPADTETWTSPPFTIDRP
ncbi:S8 family serine peptidase [Streptomyces vilmorinianum]|uniref:S8 family serine peptidase n=1 Tax=Streptomyces vilmorinianum TaxID=3051092 RepID=UPI0010FADD58|nr:S8 family serine peptidase [Streptomyces vilmorinianum]